MTKGLNRSRARAPNQRQIITKLTIPITNLALTVAGVTGIGFGSVPIRGLPEGNVLLLGAVSNIQVNTSDAGVIANWTGSFSIGTTANTDTALAGTEVDIIPATTITAATAKLSPVIRGAQGSQSVVDNTNNNTNMNLNLLIDDASISSNAPVVVNGFLAIAYIVLGDD